MFFRKPVNAEKPGPSESPMAASKKRDLMVEIKPPEVSASWPERLPILPPSVALMVSRMEAIPTSTDTLRLPTASLTCSMGMPR